VWEFSALRHCNKEKINNELFATMKRIYNFTYVIAYTISRKDVNGEFKSFLESSAPDGGLDATFFDQSTCGTMAIIGTRDLLVKLQNKLNELYTKYKVLVKDREGDTAFL
jgi:hypothetical protein